MATEKQFGEIIAAPTTDALMELRTLDVEGRDTTSAGVAKYTRRFMQLTDSPEVWEDFKAGVFRGGFGHIITPEVESARIADFFGPQGVTKVGSYTVVGKIRSPKTMEERKNGN